jgi:hypothetical protein
VSPLTNLAHLDWLRGTVTLSPLPAHTTYRLDREPAVEVVWTYSQCRPDGSYRRIGGGRYDPATDRCAQGAFNADDIARAAVVYLRHWRATGNEASRAAAYGLLRGLTYLQTASGPDAGNVVLWMQPHGTLNPAADPPEDPHPSDSGESFWLARTVWALGEGYAAFQSADPGFAAFLRDRFDLAVAAIERQSLARYGRWLLVDGTARPAWLIAHGADSTGEALLGLAAFVGATGCPRAGTALDRLAEGVAMMSGGSARTWPFGAVLPAARNPLIWHGWGGLAPAGLARAYAVRGGAALRRAALADAASFTPHLLVAGGPDNSWVPAPADRVQIPYGAHSRVESLLAVATCLDRPGLVELAGIAATWFFGNNPAGVPVYDPSTGRTADGIDVPGVVNPESGAESTVHGLLAMLALDANPVAAAIARTATVHDRRTWTVLEPATGADAVLDEGDELRLSLPALPGHDRTLLMPVVRQDAGGGRAALRTLPTPVTAGRVTLTAAGGPTRVQAVLAQPELEWLTLGGSDIESGTAPGAQPGTALVRSFAATDRHATIAVPGDGPAAVAVHDQTGRVLLRYTVDGATIPVVVPDGGFTIVTRQPTAGG